MSITPMEWLLPESVHLRREESRVDWITVSREDLIDHRMCDTFTRIKAKGGSPSDWTSKLDALHHFSHVKDYASPTFILHTSRCGSTLLSNILRSNREILVLAEPPALFPILMPIETKMWPTTTNHEHRDNYIRGVVNSLSAPAKKSEHVVIKCASFCTLFWRDLRRLWPNSRIIFMFRDPIEVLVSIMRRPVGWMRLKQSPEIGALILGVDEKQIQQMTIEDYISLVYSKFAFAAIDNLDQYCFKLNYSDLSEETIKRACSFARITPPSSDSFEYFFARYSKDPTNTRRFVRDIDEKQKAASALISKASDAYARPAFNRLIAVSQC